MSELRRDRAMTLRDLTAAAILPDAKPEREATATVKERKRSLCPGVPASPLHPIPRKLEALSPSCPNRSSSEEKLSKGALGHSHAGPESESAKSLVRIPHNRNEWIEASRRTFEEDATILYGFFRLKMNPISLPHL